MRRARRLTGILSKLEAALRLRALTAGQIARRFHCTRPTAYGRLAMLRALLTQRGVELCRGWTRDQKKRCVGPWSIAYYIEGASVEGVRSRRPRAARQSARLRSRRRTRSAAPGSQGAARPG